MLRDADPCWNGYEAVGMKQKEGKTVPNCVKADAAGQSKPREGLRHPDVKGPDDKYYVHGTTFHKIDGKLHAVHPSNVVRDSTPTKRYGLFVQQSPNKPGKEFWYETEAARDREARDYNNKGWYVQSSERKDSTPADLLAAADALFARADAYEQDVAKAGETKTDVQREDFKPGVKVKLSSSVLRQMKGSGYRGGATGTVVKESGAFVTLEGGYKVHYTELTPQ